MDKITTVTMTHATKNELNVIKYKLGHKKVEDVILMLLDKYYQLEKAKTEVEK